MMSGDGTITLSIVGDVGLDMKGIEVGFDVIDNNERGWGTG